MTPCFLGCGGRSEDTTSWGLIVGTVFFSVIYNFSRFFEFKVERITEEFIFSNATGQFKHIDQQNPLGKGYLPYFQNLLSNGLKSDVNIKLKSDLLIEIDFTYVNWEFHRILKKGCSSIH